METTLDRLGSRRFAFGLAWPIVWVTLTAAVVIILSVGTAFAADVPVATVPVGTSPAVVAVNPLTHNVFVGNYYSDSVSVIDGVTRSSVATIAMPTAGSIAVPIAAVVDVLSGKTYVGNFWSNYVSVIDGSTLGIVATISPPASHGSGVRALAADPSGTTPKVYAAVFGKNVVSVIDGSTDAVIKNISVGNSPRAIAVFASGSHRRVYVANRYSNDVSIIDGNTDSVIATVPTGASPKVIGIDPDRGFAYVTSTASDTVTVIDDNDQVTATIPVGDNPIGVGVDPAGRRVIVANYASNTVSVIDADTLSVVATVATGVQPMAIAVDRSSRKVYVSCYGSSEVTMIDSALVATSIATGYRPYALGIDEALASHQIYSANWGANNVTVIDPLGGTAGPVSVTVDSMSGNTTSSTSPIYSGTASSSRTPLHSNIVAVYYRIDSDPAWHRAQIVAGAGTPSVSWRAEPNGSLSEATHTIVVAAMDQALVVSSSSDQGAGGDSAALGGGASYKFTVAAAPPANHDWYVDASIGTDTGSGNSASAPFKSVTRATLAADAGDTIHVAAGLYGTASTGEVFPIHMIDGVLQGASSSSVTILGNGVAPVIQAAGIGSSAKIDGFTITGGSLGLELADSDLTISNNVISANVGGITGGGIHTASGNTRITDNAIRGNTATYGGGLMVSDADTSRIESNTIETNVATQGGGGIDVFLNSTPMITHNIIRNNSAHMGGAILSESGCLPRITETVIASNTADPAGGGKGGALALFSGSATLENCLITGNTSSDYAISGINSAATSIVNCTIADNSPAGIGRFSTSWPFTVAVRNSILRNTGSEIDSGTVATIGSSDIEGGYAGAGNIDADPKFVNPPANYRLAPASPCVDAGAAEAAITHDLDGAARPAGGGWDMGAYESEVSAADTTPPTVSIMIPNDGTVVSGTVWIGASAGDTGSGIARVEFRADGSLFYTAIGGYMYIADWDSSGAAPGPHVIKVTAYDGAGNSASTSITVLIAEVAPPSVSITSPESRAVTFNGNGGSRVDTQTLDVGSLVATPVPDPTRAGYAFAGWYSDSALTSRWDFSAHRTGAADMVLYAKWVRTYAITGNAGAHGSLSIGRVAVVRAGSDVTVTITPAAGYSIATVKVDGVSKGRVSAYTFRNVNTNHAIAATFKRGTSTALTASATTIRKGRYVALSARLKSSTGRFADTYVRYEVKVPHSSRYVLLKRLKVSSAGRSHYRFKVLKGGTHYYRVRFLGNTTFLPASVHRGVALRVR